METKVCVITGANSGIGYETALELAKRGFKVFLATRSLEKGEAARDAIGKVLHKLGLVADVSVLALNLASFQSVRRFASEFLALGLPLHVLINNGGVFASAYEESEDGLELNMATNHFGHFLLTKLLLPLLKQSAPSRVIVLSSEAHKVFAPREGILFDNINLKHGEWGKNLAYGHSKLANALFSAHLHTLMAREGCDVTTYCVHPGLVSTKMASDGPALLSLLARVGGKSAEDGARTSVYVGTHPDAVKHSGRYWSDMRIAKESSFCSDEIMKERLWKLSDDVVEGKAYALDPRSRFSVSFECVGVDERRDHKGDAYDAYKFVVRCAEAGINLTLQKRYSDFQELDESLQKELGPYANVPRIFKPLPLRPFTTKEQWCEDRKLLFLQYLADVSAVPAVRRSFFFNLFCRLYDLAGKNILVTGGTSGIGHYAALHMAEQGGCVFITSRSLHRAQEHAARMQEEVAKTGSRGRIEGLELDLSSLESVKAFAKTFKGAVEQLHILCNNAGLAATPEGESLSKDGLEGIFATNHIGMVRVTHELMPLVQKVNGRIVITSSIGHVQADPAKLKWDEQTMKTPTKRSLLDVMARYGVSKLANSLFAKALSERYPSVATFHIHPGAVWTNIWDEIPGLFKWIGEKIMLSSEQGSHAITICALSYGIECFSGRYLDTCKLAHSPVDLDDAAVRAILEECWVASLKWAQIDDFGH